MNNFLSLYDYLGYPAGEELGLRVATFAKANKIETQSRYVKTKYFSGYVLLYPLYFLKDYFKNEKQKHNI